VEIEYSASAVTLNTEVFYAKRMDFVSSSAATLDCGL
jgi:hypothetical protein